MKTLNIFLIISILLFSSCKKDSKELSDTEKLYDLPTKYDKISEKGLTYVCHANNNFVTVINTESQKPIGKINCGTGSVSICFSTDRMTGYITNYKDLTIFDTKNNTTKATINAGDAPVTMLIVQNGSMLLISHESAEGIWVLETKTNTIVKKLPECTGPMYMIESENKIYQPQIFTPNVFVIDPIKLEVIKKFKTGGRPMSMAFINQKKFAYLANLDLNEVTKYDTKTDSAIKSIKNINKPRGIASTFDEKFIYVTNVTENTVTVISTEIDSVFKVINGFNMPTSIGFTLDKKFAYVTNQADESVSIIDTKTYQIIKTIKVASNPISIFIDN